MMLIKQVFNPPLKICSNNCDVVSTVNEREWCIANEDNANAKNVVVINYIGCMQIEEVWKHYNRKYYVSNYGYVVKIEPNDSHLIPKELKNANKDSAGYSWKNFSNELKKLFREKAFVPFNRKNSGCQICLNITGNTSQYDIHKIIARFFLKKPDDYANKRYVIHHIDNNSYNNSVTNLIYLPADTHYGNKKKIYHPMS